MRTINLLNRGNLKPQPIEHADSARYILPYRIAKAGYWMLLFVFGLISLSSIAQNADSIILIHKNRTTIIPVPENSKKTTVEINDSNRVIEICVSSRDLPDDPGSSLDYLLPARRTKTIKWFSRIETGYTVIFSQKQEPRYYYDPYDSLTHWHYYNNDIIQGLKVGLSVYEKQKSINEKFSFVLGFDLGYSVLTRKGKSPPESLYDSVVNLMIGGEPIKINRFQLLCPLEFRYRITHSKSVSYLRMGINLGASFDIYNFNLKKGGNYIYSLSGNTPFVIQPKLGWESERIGFIAIAEFRIRYYKNTYEGLSFPFSFALTYRLY